MNAKKALKIAIIATATIATIATANQNIQAAKQAETERKQELQASLHLCSGYGHWSVKPNGSPRCETEATTKSYEPSERCEANRNERGIAICER